MLTHTCTNTHTQAQRLHVGARTHTHTYTHSHTNKYMHTYTHFAPPHDEVLEGIELDQARHEISKPIHTLKHTQTHTHLHLALADGEILEGSESSQAARHEISQALVCSSRALHGPAGDGVAWVPAYRQRHACMSLLKANIALSPCLILRVPAYEQQHACMSLLKANIVLSPCLVLRVPAYEQQRTRIFRVGQHHIYIRCIFGIFGREYQIYGHLRYIHMVLANPVYVALTLSSSQQFACPLVWS